MQKITFIPELLEIAKKCNRTIEAVFTIAYDYGLIDELGNVTSEVLEVKNSIGITL